MKKWIVEFVIRLILDGYIETLDKKLRERGKHIHENPKNGQVGRRRKPKIAIVKEEPANEQG